MYCTIDAPTSYERVLSSMDDCIDLHFADVAKCCFPHDSPHEPWPIYRCITATHSPAGIRSRSAGTTR